MTEIPSDGYGAGYVSESVHAATAPLPEPELPQEYPQDDLDHVFACTRVEDVTADMKTFVLEPAGPGTITYEPGQYLAFTFDIDGEEVGRCYTISSAPTRPHAVTITVKRVPGGRVSNWLHDNFTVGSTVSARGPFGDFSNVHHPAPAYLFLSGGSGVTPLMSMTRTMYDHGAPADIAFVHSARTPDDIPFRAELELFDVTSRNIRVTHVCEADGEAEQWEGHRGRLTLEALEEIAPDFREREVFVCGPAGYMRAVHAMLTEAGLPEERYHQESFDGATAVPATPADTGTAQATYAVEFSRTGTTVECGATTTLLQAAAEAGLTLPSSCGQGMCGSCVSPLSKGTVDMRDNGGLRPRQRAQGKILLCCSTPLEDLVIDA
ncbi:hybrid-cluster NAD(P)-dependent oxidoreductase [Streptomyces cavernicola]|uniref:Hybrid-cluster NAD(P)-dependent oxidoreductase n=1 Tax=Streptomyces cavernicola TaxID=3043613 RepID=A0ABT6SE44_9ACTN|nr:hybrid-cluster NAD(P)-dependent oxidoreductase [Streptomyces sp. B-S-A6]MDI3406453.1 hybrid-cluster NAD(P)-dependent oxidoreductase [Streptomyces sp. B-S-A6]